MSDMTRSHHLRSPDAILLDVDDTLVEWSQTLPIAWSTACKRIAGIYDGVDAEMLDAYISYHLKNTTELPDTEIIDRALTRFGIDDSSAATTMLDGMPADRLAALKPVHGVAAAVRQIRQKVRKLGVLTSGSEDVQCTKLRLLGVEGLLDVVVTSDETGHTKGDRKIYEIAAQRLGVEPSKTWMVGDSLDWDVASSQAAGMTGIWVVWPASKFREIRLPDRDLPQNSEVVPDLIVKHLRDLLPYLS